MSLDQIARVNITADTLPRSQVGFKLAMIVGYHELWEELSRAYASPAEWIEDGGTTNDPIYMALQRAFSVTPRPEQVKVGRRRSAPIQTIRLTPTGTVAGTVYTIEIGGQTIASYTVSSGDTVADICAALTTAVNALTGAFTAVDNTTHVTVTANTVDDPDSIITAHATAATPLVLDDTDLNGVIGQGDIIPASLITATLNAHADWNATEITINGLDAWGNVASEALTVPDGGNVTLTTTARFSRITSVEVDAQAGTNGSFTIGTVTPPGTLFDYRDWNAELELLDVTPDPGITDDLVAIRAFDADWYGLGIDSQGDEEVLATAAWAESEVVIFGWNTSNTECTQSAVTDCVASQLEDFGYARTIGLFSGVRLLSYSGLAWVIDRLRPPPGQSTWAYATLPGVEADSLSTNQSNTLIGAPNGAGFGKRLNTYTEIGGVNVTRKGVTAAGEWADVTVFLDWLRIRLQERIFALLQSATAQDRKVAMTDEGADAVRDVVTAQLQDGVDVGGLAKDPKFTVTVPKMSSLSSTQRNSRVLPSVRFDGRLAGAIHEVNVDGSLSV